MIVSIVIRTLNEEKYLNELLTEISNQNHPDFDVETIIIDSGSTDNTILIAKKHKCRITYIDKEEFTFGRSLNKGAEFSRGDILIFVSGHCVPVERNWLVNLVNPIYKNETGISYGRQIGRDTTKFSENILFQKYFPQHSKNPQKGFFCNNANSAICRSVWNKYMFDEDVTGLEDMELAKRYTEDGGKVAYIADAAVYHIHNETWAQTRRRYERESIALKRKSCPKYKYLFMTCLDTYVLEFILMQKSQLLKIVFYKEIFEIIKFRIAQFSGSYRGNHTHRELSKERKEIYFYPNKKI